MASPTPNPREVEEGDPESEESSPQHEAPTQKRFVALPASQLPSKLQYVALTPGPSGIKQCFRTVKAARRVPTLPRTGKEPAPSASSIESERRARRDRSAKRHACSTCDKRFTSPGKLNQHILLHTGELPFSCNRCDKKFNSRFKLVRHNLIHNEDKAFVCGICNKSFSRKDHLTNHSRIHNPVKKLYTCERPLCKKSYTSLLSYRKHSALHSAEEGNLQCKICDETFTNQGDIVYHLKLHTGSRSVKNESDKKFTCDYCERKFFTAKDVRRHLVVHTGRRDFLCPFCPQKFGRKDHLVRHVKNAHPEESWKSAAVGTSKEPPMDTISVRDTNEITVETSHANFNLWDPTSPNDSASEGAPTRVPSSEVIVELPEELLDLKDPLDIKTEAPSSPSKLLPVDFPIFYVPISSFTQAASEITYLSSEPISDPLVTDPIQAQLLDPENVDSILLDPGEGQSSLSGDVLRGLLEQPLEQSDSSHTQSYSTDDVRLQQRLPAFTQAFQTSQSSKPPPPPPPN